MTFKVPNIGIIGGAYIVEGVKRKCSSGSSLSKYFCIKNSRRHVISSLLHLATMLRKQSGYEGMELKHKYCQAYGYYRASFHMVEIER